MLVKKFEAPSIQEALETIKRELGPEAVILQTRRNKKGFGLMSNGSIEVTAAISEKDHEKKKIVDRQFSEASRDVMSKLPAEKQRKLYDKYIGQHLGRITQSLKSSDSPQPETQSTVERPSRSTRYVDILDDGSEPSAVRKVPVAQAPMPTRVPAPVSSAITKTMEQNSASPELLAEVNQLKKLVEDLRKTSNVQAKGANHINTPLKSVALEQALESMILQGLDRQVALEILRHVEFDLDEKNREDENQVMDTLAGELLNRVETTQMFSQEITESDGQQGPQIFSLIGPTGVGKTTTLAKLASEAKLKLKKKVALINLDAFKIAASDQIASYAKILNIPYRTVNTAEGLQSAIEDFKHFDMILIDTTGRSQKDGESLREMEKLMRSVRGVRCHLLLSVTTKDTELLDMANRFSIFKPEGLIMTKLDEGIVYGSIFNVSHKLKLPLSYFTTGQRVPEDIESASAERLTALLLGL